jgi:hypothetical protein
MAILRKFFSGAFGTFCLLLIRGLPPLPWLSHYANIWWLGAVLTVSGGVVTVIWDDDHPFRSFYFGATWPAMVAALTR